MKTRFISIVCVVFAVFVYVLGRPLGFMLYTKWNLRANKALWLVPQPLPQSASPAAGPKLNYFGAEFESPAGTVKEDRKAECVVVLNFDDCAGIVFLKPSDPSSKLTAMRQAEKPGKTIEGVFGREATASDYSSAPKPSTSLRPTYVCFLRLTPCRAIPFG